MSPPGTFESLRLEATPLRAALPAWHARAGVERLREIEIATESVELRHQGRAIV